MLLNNQLVTEGIKEGTETLLETNKNESTMISIYGTTKAVLRGRFTVIPDCFRRQKKTQIN